MIIMALTETKLNKFKSTHIRTLKLRVNRNCEGGLENESTKVVTVGNFSIQSIHLVLLDELFASSSCLGWGKMTSVDENVMPTMECIKFKN